MRDELAVKTIEDSLQIGRNHPMIQQRQKYCFFQSRGTQSFARFNLLRIAEPPLLAVEPQ
ncbi:hypothetical protein [Nostoc commune]|uniref:hypothetical protein n=1 Tax=Nostoc commune TaxID=1178 RepID=UPI0018C604F2|nr:hypothetical protein [Nostoc commune]MBG1262930.1 hypothetical protein [Nostoc commune BAE]